MHFGKLRDEKGLIDAPAVLGFNNGIILSELQYLNLNNTSESVSSVSKIIEGFVSLIALIILWPLPRDGI